MTSRPRIPVPSLFLLVGLALAGDAACQTPAALDSTRMLQDLAALAHDSMQGRAAGSAGAERARAFLSRALSEAGTVPLGSGYAHPFSWDRGPAANLVGVVPGSDPLAPVIVLSAHYDHLGVRGGEVYNGADDNASGTAAALEIARLVVRTPLRHTLVVALLDAEEAGSVGARALLESGVVLPERVALNVNLDMVSRTGGTLWVAGASHTPELRPILERVAASAPVTLRLGHDRPGAPEGDDWTGASDHSAFHAFGIPFVYFGVEDHPDYHRPTDDYERIDAGEYLAAVRTILTAVRALDAALPLAPAGNP